MLTYKCLWNLTISHMWAVVIFPHLPFEILIDQNYKKEEARCLTEVLYVTTITLPAQIMTPFKEAVEAGSSLFSLEVDRALLFIYWSVIF